MDPRSKRAQARANAKPIPCEKLGHKRCRVDINVDGSLSHHIDGKEIREHILVFQQYHKCCLLPGKAVRHINGINWDNRPENLEYWSHRARADQFGKYSKPIPKNRRCARCHSRKTKPNEKGIPHWYKGHTNGDYAGELLCDKCRGWDYGREVKRIRRRVIEQETGHNCCLLPNTEVSFINGDSKDIRRENLEVLWKGQTNWIGRRIPADRRCINCGWSHTNAKFNPKNGSFHPVWYRRDGGFICNQCRTEERREDDRKAAGLDAYIRALELQQKLLFDPNYKLPEPIRCALCCSTKTGIRTESKGGTPDWYRLNPTGEGPIEPGEPIQCRKCYNTQKHAEQRQNLIEAAGGSEAYEEAKRLRNKEAQRLRRRREKPYEYKHNAWKMAEMRRELSQSPEPPRRCAECGSYTTRKNYRRPTHYGTCLWQWYKLGGMESAGGLYQCHNCHENLRRRHLSRDKRDGANAVRRARKKVLKELKAKSKPKAKAKVGTPIRKVHARRVRPAPNLLEDKVMPPLGILYLSAWFRKHGHDPQVIDLAGIGA